MDRSDHASILVVDDNTLVLESTCALLSSRGFSIVACAQSSLAAQRLREHHFDAVLSDIKMPVMTGLELLDTIRATDPDLPVVLMTAFAEFDLALDAIGRGAFDFVLKPWTPDHLTLTMKKAVKYHKLLQIEKEYKKALEGTVQKRTRELVDALEMVKGLSSEVVQRLTTVTEFRDSETGEHVARIALFTRCIAQAMSMPPAFVDTIAFASPMHDIGKVVVPDAILLKPGALTLEEFETIKAHTIVGEKILSGSKHPSIQMAASIALCHHERQDGSGYPRGLKGETIPIEGRITMLCDQYDALTSKRPYKNAFSHEDAVRIIFEGDGRTLPRYFHSDVLKAFSTVANQLKAIRAQLS